MKFSCFDVLRVLSGLAFAGILVLSIFRAHADDSQKSPPKTQPHEDIGEFFEKQPHRESIDPSQSLLKPWIMWSPGVGISFMNTTGARGAPSLGMNLSFHEGFWRFTRIGFSLFGDLSHVMITPGAHMTWYFLGNHIRLQPHLTFAVLLGGDTLSGAWFNRHTLGLSTGFTFHYFLNSRWGAFLHAQSGLFFPSKIVIRPQVMLGTSYAFF